MDALDWSVKLCLSCKVKENHQFLQQLHQKTTRNVLVLTHDVVHAERAGAVLQQPRVNTVFMELMSTGNDPQKLGRKGGGS